MDAILVSRRRLRRLAAFILLWAVVILGRLIHLQVVRHRDYLTRSIDQAYDTLELPASRGTIVDRSGQTLAVSVPAETVVINPRQIRDRSIARDILCPVLELDPRELQARLDWAVEENRGYLVLKRRIGLEESRKLRRLNLNWIQLHADSRRHYPKGNLAANVVGSVNFENQGNSGLELSLDADLRGKPGVARILHDARPRTIHTEVLTPPEPGTAVGISIDERIQYVADRELKRAAQEYGCSTGSLVVIIPRTGEILAMSNYPSFDPSSPVTSPAELASRANLAVSVPFEPGSVFKIITISAALETTDLRPSTPINCGPGVLSLFGRRIHDIHAYGTIPVEKVLAKSSNIGAIQIGLRVGERRLLEYVRRFGFGARTGIPLPAESAGRVRDLNEWRRTSIGSVAMGHEISATSLQLALAASAIANGGVLPEPRLVLWREQPRGARIKDPVRPGRRVLKPETAIMMRRMMEGVVLAGTGRQAKLNGYSSGGKTGSAQIFDFETRRYSHRYNSSFVGFAPVVDPAVVVAVTLNGASKYGGVVAAPVFREVAQAALRILSVVPDVPDDKPLPEPAPDELDDLAVADLGTPPDGTDLASTRDQPPSPFVLGPKVPDFYGKTLRAVLRETSRLGVELEFSGTGIAHAQYPPPGTVLPVGERVHVQFAR